MRELTFGGSRRNSNISDNLPATRNLQPAKIKHSQRNALSSFSTAWYPPLWPSNERSVSADEKFPEEVLIVLQQFSVKT